MVAVGLGGGRRLKIKARLLFLLSLTLVWWVTRAGLSSRMQEARSSISYLGFGRQPADIGPPPYNASKLALLIEPRPIPHLIPQLLHMMAVVPPDWRFLFVGSSQSVGSVGGTLAIRHHQYMGKLDLMELPDPWVINNREGVSRTLADVRFYNEFLPGVEWVLKYDHDNILCSKSDSNLDDWLEWSWAWPARIADGHSSGNGGISLRRVSAIKRLLNLQKRHNNSEPEDEWFGQHMAVLPGENVTARLDGAFAVGNVIKGPSTGHNQQRDYEAGRKMLEFCPELRMVMSTEQERSLCSIGEGGGSGTLDEAQLVVKDTVKEDENPHGAQAQTKALAGNTAKQQTLAEGIIPDQSRTESRPPPLPPMDSR